MATGKARPDLPENSILPSVVSPAFGSNEAIARREHEEPKTKAKSKPEIEAENENVVTGEEVHAKAREMAEDAEDKKAAGQKVKKVTGKAVLAEVKKDKKDGVKADEERASDIPQRDAEVKKAQAEEKKERDAADAKLVQEGEKAKADAVAKQEKANAKESK